MSENTSDFYTVGGTLEHKARSYVPRDADKVLHKQLKAGRYCYVLNPRQVGKSSLMVQVAESLKADGVHVAIVDLQAVSKASTDESWYYAVLKQIGRGLGLEQALRTYWLQTKQVGPDADLISPLERWINALKEVVLKERSGQVVVFVDEIDLVRSYTQFSADEFFLAIRYLHGEQKQSELNRLSFCLIGVATPSDLIKDTRVTSFNIGERVELQDFTESEAAGLAEGLRHKNDLNKKLLHRILYWTGGHPYLTQSLCQAVAINSAVTDTGGVDRVCNDLFLSPDVQGKDTNLSFVRDRMLLKEAAERESRPDSELVGLLSLYSEIHKGKRVPAHESNPLVSILTLSGLAKAKGGYLTTRNRIYQKVFDQRWIENNMPDAELRRQRTQYRRKLLGLAVVALIVIAVLGTSTAVAFWQKRKTDQTLIELGVTKESLRTAKEDLDKREKDLQVAQAAIATKQNEINLKDQDLISKEIEIGVKTRAAQKKTEEAHHLKRIADDRLVSVNKLEYAAKVNLAKSLYDDGNIDSVVKVLGETDPNQRGVEWSFLNHLMEGLVPFINIGEEHIDGLLFSPDGKYLVTEGTAPPLLVWDPKSGQQQELILGDDLRAFSDYVFSPDGKWFASYGSATGIILWDTSTHPWKRHPVTTDTQNEAYKFVSFTPNNEGLLTLSQREQAFFLRYWDVQTRKQIGERDLKELGTQFGMKNLEVLRFAFGDHLLIRYEEPIPGTESHKTVVALLSSLSLFRTILGYQLTDGQYVYAFSANGKVMAEFLSGDSYISIRRNFVEEASSQRLENSTSSTNWKDIELSSNGKLIAALNHQEVRIWDTETQKIVRIIPLVNHLYKSIAFSPDGLKLAIGGFDEDGFEAGALTLWDVYSEADVFSFNREKFLAASLDGTKVVTQNADGYLNLWNTIERRSITVPITSERWQSDTVTFSPNGNHFVAFLRELGVGDKQTLRLWNAVSGTEVQLKSQTKCRFTMSTAFSPDGKRLISICRDGNAQVFDVETGNEINTFLTNTGAGTLYSIWQDRRTTMFVTDKQLIISKPRHPEISGSLDAEVTSWDLERGIRQEIGVCSENVIKVSSDSKWLVTRDFKDDYRLRSTTNQRCDLPPLISGDDDESLDDIAFSEDSKFLGVFYIDTHSHEGEAHYVVKDLTTMKDTILEQALEASDGKIKFSPSAHWVLFGNNYWNTRTGNGNKIVGCTANPKFSADETRLVTSCGDGNIKLWDLESGQEVLKIRAHDSAVDMVFIMPDNKHMLTATKKDVKLWRLRF